MNEQPLPGIGAHPPARFSPDGRYRYTLPRVWGDPGGREVAWVALNPSTADDQRDDPTVRRMIGYSMAWGYDRLTVLNLFALRSTSPKALYDHPDPVGPYNDDVIACTVPVAHLTVVAWGLYGRRDGRNRAVLELLDRLGVTPSCLGLTASGEPLHPLYLPAETVLRPYERPRR